MPASTKSAASISASWVGPYSGDLGRAVKPVLADSKTPNGAMSFMKESILDGFADLEPKDTISIFLPQSDRGRVGRHTPPQYNY